jgi:SAM-dependent methyltransferase
MSTTASGKDDLRGSYELVEEAQSFWNVKLCGSEFVEDRSSRKAFFDDLTRTRQELEPHIPEVVRFETWADKDVLEIGCGLGTDGERFARSGARYTAVDLSPEPLALTRERFELSGLAGRFVNASATELPFEDESFDLVYSHGVIHHIPPIEQVAAEIHRVLRPGGTALIMVYNRSSLNYHLNIRILRRIGALLLKLPRGTELARRLTGERPEVLEGHVELLNEHGLRYIRDLDLFLNHNTDGPGNPHSTVWSAREADRLFSAFGKVDHEVRLLNLRSYPAAIRRRVSPELESRLARRLGWHRYIIAVK